MKNWIKYAFILCLGMFSMTMQAQNYAYMDSAVLLEGLPEVKQADSQLEALQKQLTKQGQQKVQALQTKYQDLSQQEQAGTIAPSALQAEVEKLKAEEMEIAQFEQDMQKQLAEKRQQLLQPILDKVQGIIDQIAAEEGYSYVFDSSTGVLLYADESKDITDKVKSRLN